MSTKTGNTANTRHVQATEMPWVRRWLAPLASQSTVLDFAAGSGRHSRLASTMGLRVVAADRDAGALAELAESDSTIVTECADLESDPWPFVRASFDAVIVTNYLFRPRLDLLCTLLAPGGRLIYATFGQGNERFGKPSNPDYLLRPGELLALAQRAGLTVTGYEHGLVTGNQPAVVQRVCALRDMHGAGSHAIQDRMMLLDTSQP